MKKVSVIIPVYNVEKYLEKCLDSLLNQSFPKEYYEIICVNDDSTDCSGDILTKYVSKYSDRIKLLENKENQCLGKTRDYALTEAEGEYVLFVDSDDYVKRDYIREYYQKAASTKPDIVIGGYIKAMGETFETHNEFRGIWALVSYTVVWAKMYRREFLVENELKFLHRYQEDIYFNLNAFLCKPRIELIEYAGYYYRFNPKSIMGTMNSDKNIEVTIDRIFGEILKKKPVIMMTQWEKQVIEYVYVTHIVNSMLQYNRGCGVKKMRSKYQFCFGNLKRRFPEYKKNPYFSFREPKGESRKIRLVVGGVMTLHKLCLDRVFFCLLSIRLLQEGKRRNNS